ncbi:MAG: hypothetical protein JXR70_13075, partial [Spirochaetales bacterium]|nr:hypothetical protein [Spirochaetales bacterium]
VAKAGQPNSMTDERSLQSPKWNGDKATVGEEVTLSVKIQSQQGLRGGVEFKIYPEGADPKKDPPVATKTVRQESGTAEVKWRYQYIPGPESLTAKPRFFFEAWAFRCEKVKSGLIEMGMVLKAKIVDGIGNPVENIGYTLYQPDGSGQEGKTSDNGLIDETDLIPGVYKIVFNSKESG